MAAGPAEVNAEPHAEASADPSMPRPMPRPTPRPPPTPPPAWLQPLPPALGPADAHAEFHAELYTEAFADPPTPRLPLRPPPAWLLPPPPALVPGHRLGMVLPPPRRPPPLALLALEVAKTKALRSEAAPRVELRPKRPAPKPHAEAPAVPCAKKTGGSCAKKGELVRWKRMPRVPCAKKGELLRWKRMPRAPKPHAEAPAEAQRRGPMHRPKVKAKVPWVPWSWIQGPPPKADVAPAEAHAKARAHGCLHAKPHDQGPCPRPTLPDVEPPSRGRRRARPGPRIPEALPRYRRWRAMRAAEAKKEEGRKAKDKKEAKKAEAWARAHALEVKAEPDSEADAEPNAEAHTEHNAETV